MPQLCSDEPTREPKRRAGGPGEQARDAPEGQPAARLLRPRRRIRGLEIGGVGHADGSALQEDDPSASPAFAVAQGRKARNDFAQQRVKDREGETPRRAKRIACDRCSARSLIVIEFETFECAA